jgi:hypothetical protein
VITRSGTGCPCSTRIIVTEPAVVSPVGVNEKLPIRPFRTRVCNSAFVTGRIRYAALARRGLLVRAHCGAPCTIDAALLLARALARTYGLASAPVVVGAR